jgi:hypothetical protein
MSNMTTITKKIASPAYIAGEYYIFTAILDWVFNLIAGFAFAMLLELLGVPTSDNSTYFYIALVVVPVVYWFAVKYSALNTMKRYMITDYKKDYSFRDHIQDGNFSMYYYV